MRFRFRPVDRSFYDLFSESAGHLVVGATILAEMLADGHDREDIALRMRNAEQAADETTHAIVKRVNSSFVTPFDRGDIYALASALDDVMDLMDEAVDLVMLYGVTVLPAETSEQVDVLQRCAELTAEAMPRLATMKSLDEYWVEINRLENVGDRSYRHILARIFSGDYKTMQVIKFKDIAESLEGAIDAFEKVAHILEQISVKES